MVYTRTVLSTFLVVGNAFVFAAPVSESNTGGLATEISSLRSSSGPGREGSSNSGELKNNKRSSPQHGSPDPWSPASTATGLESLDREDSLAPYGTPTNPPDRDDPHPAPNSHTLIDSNTPKKEIKQRINNLVRYGPLRERAQELLSNEHPPPPYLWNLFLSIFRHPSHDHDHVLIKCDDLLADIKDVPDTTIQLQAILLWITPDIFQTDRNRLEMIVSKLKADPQDKSGIGWGECIHTMYLKYHIMFFHEAINMRSRALDDVSERQNSHSVSDFLTDSQALRLSARDTQGSHCCKVPLSRRGSEKSHRWYKTSSPDDDLD
ncbi:hypothetical protein F5879DRAFT_964802 [Lentinula edodes]|uniref:Uncharacterized protein n=1 Tax=Lentinula edodes TaxID=5353 RepID=A0A1Q3E6X4_LENED|nr:hypothetical protein F5879DRAFT_964802 [Lentinula edodes]GAW02951.1 hypothetical protein LENED_004631 [Lentinula edodes]